MAKKEDYTPDPPTPVETDVKGASWLLEDPDFKAAVAASLRDQLAGLREELAAATQPSVSGLPIDALALIQNLALQIASIGVPEREKPVDPKILAARAKAMEKLGAALMEAKALPKGHPDIPKYHCTSRVILNDTQIEPWRRDPARKLAVRVEFRWKNEPNDAMVPLNDLAKKIFALFRESRGNADDYQKEVRNSVWLSDGGLVIEGSGRPIPNRREIIAPQEDPGELVVDDDPYSPNAPTIAVLGTIHAPAQQNFAGKVP